MIWNPLSVWKVFCLYKKNLKQEAPKLQKQKQVINATTDVIIMTSPFFTRIWKFPFLRLSFCKDNPSHQANFAWFIKIRLRKWNFFRAKEFFTWTLISKMAVKMKLRIITKNHAADSEIEFFEKSISKPNGCATAMPTALELNYNLRWFISNSVA